MVCHSAVLFGWNNWGKTIAKLNIYILLHQNYFVVQNSWIYWFLFDYSQGIFATVLWGSAVEIKYQPIQYSYLLSSLANSPEKQQTKYFSANVSDEANTSTISSLSSKCPLLCFRICGYERPLGSIINTGFTLGIACFAAYFTYRTRRFPRYFRQTRVLTAMIAVFIPSIIFTLAVFFFIPINNQLFRFVRMQLTVDRFRV